MVKKILFALIASMPIVSAGFSCGTNINYNYMFVIGMMLTFLFGTIIFSVIFWWTKHLMDIGYKNEKKKKKK